jgi:hypothetical protein
MAAGVDDEQIGRAQAEHGDRVSVNAVTQPTPSGQREVLLYGQRIDVANSAAIEIAWGRMVDGMGASPEVIGCERQHADHASNPIVCETVMEERSMTAIVLDHEQSHKKARGGYRE